MKSASLREVKEQLSHFVATSQKDSVLITKHGKPAALVVGVAGHDMEDIFYMTSPHFWRMIQRRRGQKPMSWKKAKKNLG